MPLDDHPAGSAEVTLHWRCLAETPINHMAFCHVVDNTGKLVTQHDGPTGNGHTPTHGWVTDEYIKDAHWLIMPEDLAPGEYRVMVGLYDLTTGQRLVQPSGESAMTLTQPLVVD